MPAHEEVHDKTGQPIREGNTVVTRIRGGKHEGEVDKIVYTADEAAAAGVKNPPKVLYEDQHGHRVAHNPGTLTVEREGE